jgi:hypothetical protein
MRSSGNASRRRFLTISYSYFNHLQTVSTTYTKPQQLTESRRQTQAPNLSAARAFALAASSSRFFGGAVVSSEWRRRAATAATSSTAARNEASLAFDGLLKPLIFLTNCKDAARISSALTGGSKLKRVLIFLHIRHDLNASERTSNAKDTILTYSRTLREQP